MTMLSKLALEIGLAVASIILFQFVVLLYRNPQTPRWMHRGIVVEPVCVGLIGLITLSFALLLAGLTAANVHVFMAIVIAAALFLVSLFAGSRLLKLRERLERLEASESLSHSVSGDVTHKERRLS
jgi:hypothetical protein